MQDSPTNARSDLCVQWSVIYGAKFAPRLPTQVALLYCHYWYYIYSLDVNNNNREQCKNKLGINNTVYRERYEQGYHSKIRFSRLIISVNASSKMSTGSH